MAIDVILPLCAYSNFYGLPRSCKEPIFPSDTATTTITWSVYGFDPILIISVIAELYIWELVIDPVVESSTTNFDAWPCDTAKNTELKCIQIASTLKP